MAKSQRVSKAARPIAKARRPHEVPRVQLKCDPATGLTHQSFIAECDINNIVDTYARTGLVNHVARRSPQYGDVPEATLYESACAQAAIRSAMEDGYEYPETPSEASGDDFEEEEGDTLASDVIEPQSGSEAADDESSGQLQ